MDRRLRIKGVHYTFDFDGVLPAIRARYEVFNLKIESVLKTIAYELLEERQKKGRRSSEDGHVRCIGVGCAGLTCYNFDLF